MTTSVQSLAGWLLERIAEDEADAWSAGGLFTPQRVLAECEAKRRIVELHHASTDHGAGSEPYCVGCWEAGGMDGAPSFPCLTLRLLAVPYADRAGYREEWRP